MCKIHIAYSFVLVVGLVLPYVFVVLRFRRYHQTVGKYINEKQWAIEKIQALLTKKLAVQELVPFIEQLETEIVQKEEELAKQAERESFINWTNTNTAHIAEILRVHNQSLHELGKEVLRELIEILNLNQGGLFVTETIEDKQILRLECAIAWERERYVKREHEFGYGLIGRAAFERKIIFLTDLPDGYIEITSGLGKALPRCVVIVPLIYNEQVTGVIELASFQKLTESEVAFLEKLSNAIAASIATMKTNERTQQLLEESQRNTEMLQAQDEEMRQNLEEMQTTQEEMMRKEELLKKLGYEMKQQENKLIKKIEEIKKAQRAQTPKYHEALN